ncbi:unnamed protein product, partial [Laminaria digitata]
GSFDPNSGSPWGNVPVALPGTIEAEEYDKGGQGVGYIDTTPGNRRGAFRPNDDVDIIALNEGYAVAHVAPGEFLRYTVDLPKPG